jgi:hypothetical protein
MYNLLLTSDSAQEESEGNALKRSDSLLTSPIFLVGSERSGTTLTRLMLDHHPMNAFFFEFGFAVEMMLDSEGWPDLGEYHDYLRANRIFNAANLVIADDLDYPHLIDSFLRQKRDRAGKPLVGATVHYDFDRLLRIWPGARFIHIVRDGRDVGRSTIEMGWAGNMYVAVDKWIKAELLWSGFCRELPEDRWIEIRFETLVSEPKATLSRVCAFLDIPYDPAMLEYPKHTTYDPPSTQPVGRWKRELSPEEIRLAEARIAEMLTERGYELSGHPPLRVTALIAKRLRLQSRYHCAMFRRSIFGTKLFLASALAGRLAPRSWQRPLHRRIDEIESARLK